MKIVLRPHLKIRLQQRSIPQDYPIKAVSRPNAVYFDIQTNHLIAAKKLKYGGKLKYMAVSYDIIGDTIQVITIHPISEKEIRNKLKRERWIQNEKR